MNIKRKLSLLFFLLVLGINCLLPRSVNAADLQVHVMDVGEGLGVLLESGGEYMLYDGGGRDYSSKVVSYLKKLDVQNIEILVASHYDEDHIAGLVGALHAFDVNRVYGPNYSVDTAIYSSFFNALQDKKLSLITPAMGSEISFGNCQITLLNAPYSDTENDCSLVLRVVCGSNAILLTGDAAEVTEANIINNWNDISSEILIAGHHGSSNSTGDAWLSAVSPETVVLSCGLGNAYGHPSAAVMRRLKERSVQVLRTDLQGDLRMTSNGETWSYIPEPVYEYSDGGDGGVLSLFPTEQAETGSGAGERAFSETESSEDGTGYRYVLNTNTRKFHYPDCKSVQQMKPKNTAYSAETRDELIAQGYDPCGNCHP